MTQLRVNHLSDQRQFASAINGALRRTDAIDLSADQATILFDRPMNVSGGVVASGDLAVVNAVLTGNLTVVNADASGVYKVASVQVVGARQTGWAADTGTAEKTAHATYTAGATLTFSASYTQSELTAMATRMAAVEAALQGVSRGQKAVKDAAIAHGLIGA